MTGIEHGCFPTCRPCKERLLAKSVGRFSAHVLAEHVRQEARWGIQRHPFEVWMLILGEEVGECNRAVLNLRFETGAPVKPERVSEALSTFRAELVQVAAVCAAAVEQIDEEIAE